MHAVFDLISVDDGDHVALLQARALGRASPLDVADDHAANLLESEIRGDVRSDSLNAHAQIAAITLPAFFKLSAKPPRLFAGIGKPVAVVAPVGEAILPVVSTT